MSLSSEWAMMKQSLISQIQQRGVRASNEICNTAKQVCSGASPSSPGSPPGVKSGRYRSGFHAEPQNTALGVIARCKNDVFYGVYLENGHGQEPGRFVPVLGKRLVASSVAARPHVDKIRDESLPKVEAIFAESYSL